MINNFSALVRPHASAVLATAALFLGGISVVAIAADDKPAKAALPPGVIFSAPLADVPGHDLVVVDLKFPPTTNPNHGGGHRHPGSVYVYVTEGTLRLGIEGQPIQEVHKGQSFFEPPGVLHTVAESASSTEPASAIAVMIVPKGAALVMPAH